MFIDGHAHACLYPSPPLDGRTVFCTPEQVLSRYDECGIDRGILHPLIGPEIYLAQSNQEILEICRRYPDRFIPFCNIDPRGIGNAPDTDFSVWLDWFVEHGCRGVGEFMPNLYFDDPLVMNFMAQLNSRKMVLTFDCAVRIGGHYGLVDDPGMPRLDRCLSAFPELTILGHGPAFWSEIGTLEHPEERGTYPKYPVRAEGTVAQLMRRRLNLWCDLSAWSGFNALRRDVDYAVVFLNEFQDRLCFGTDICYFTQELPLGGFLTRLQEEGRISDVVLRKIAYENIIRLLKI